MRELVSNAILGILFTAIVIILSVAVSVTFFGCSTAPSVAIEHSRRVTELENTVRDYADRIDRYQQLVADCELQLVQISGRASEAGQSVDRIISLFGEYVGIVDQLLQAYRDIETSSGAGAELQSDSGDSFNGNDSG
jgi:hypothetical protein